MFKRLKSQKQEADQLTHLSKQFEQGKRGPAPEFAAELESQFLRQAGAQPNGLVNMFASLLRPRLAFAGLLTVVLVGMVFIYTRYGSYFEVRYAEQSQVAILEGAAQKQVLEMVLSQNPQLRERYQSAVRLPVVADKSIPPEPYAASADAVTLELVPENPATANFTFSTLQIVAGPAQLNCPDYRQRPAGTVTTTQFVEVVGFQYYKQEVYSPSSELAQYELITPDWHLLWLGDESIWQLVPLLDIQPIEPLAETEYTQHEPASPPSELSESESAAVSTPFGDQVEVVTATDEDGEKYYQLSWAEDISCAEKEITIINVIRVEATNYMITSQSRYLTAETPQSLIETESIDSLQEFKELSQVWDQFQYDHDWQIRELSLPAELIGRTLLEQMWADSELSSVIYEAVNVN